MGQPHPALFALAADRPVDVFDPAGLVTSAIEHRMGGILATRLGSGDIDLDPASRIRLDEVDLATWARNQMLAEAASEAVSVADEVGLRVAIMKGLPSESRWYDRVGERPSYDVDVAVHPEDLGLIPQLVGRLHPGHSLLRDLEFLIRKGFLQSVDVTFRGMPIDLHWDPLKLELIRTRTVNILWARTELVKLSNAAVVRAFDAEASLIGHLLHLNKDRFRYLLGFADIARLLQRAELDWEFIEELLDKEGLRTPVAQSLATVVERLQLPVRRPLAEASRWRARAWRIIWPVKSQLLGDTGRVRFRHRQFLIPFTGSGRAAEAAKAYFGRLVPPRALVDYYYPHQAGPYAWKLVTARLRRGLERRRLRAAVGNDSVTR